MENIPKAWNGNQLLSGNITSVFFIKLADPDLCFLLSTFFMVYSFGMRALLMRQLKFLALASLRGDQFRRLAAGSTS